MQRLILIVLALVIGLAGASLANPASYVTTDTAMFVQLAKVEQLFGVVENYAKTFGQPMQPGQLKTLISQQLFGAPGFGGIDLSRPAGVLMLLQPPKKNPGVAFVIPVGDESRFRREVASKVSGMPVQYRGGYALIATDPATMGKLLNGARKAVALLPDSQINVYMDYAAMRPLIEDSLKQVSRMGRRGGAAGNRLTALFLSFYRDLLAQMRTQVVGINLDNRGIELGFSMRVAPGGSLAQFSAGLDTADLRTLSVLPADAYLVHASQVNWNAYGALLAGIFKLVNEAEPGLGDTLAAAVKGLGQAYGKETAMAFVPSKGGPGLNFVGVSLAKDPQRARQIMRSVVDALNKTSVLAQLRAKGGELRLDYTQGAETVEGVPVDVVRVVLTPPEGMRLGDKELAAIEFVRTLLQVRVAYAGGLEVSAGGSESKARIAEMLRLARGQAQGWKTSEAYMTLRRAYAQFPKNGVFHGSLLSLGREILEIAGKFAGDDKEISGALAMIKQLAAQPGGGFYGYSLLAGDKMEVRGMLSSTEVRNIVMLAMTMMMQNKGADKHGRDGNEGPDER